MKISQKCLYALRAIFELAKRQGQGPTKIAELAEAQAIPRRFLEGILTQLKQAGFVKSFRGHNAGYVLVRSPEELTVREVVEFIEGPVGPTACLLNKAKEDNCPLWADCIFIEMWEEIRGAILQIYERTTIADLIKREADSKLPCLGDG